MEMSESQIGKSVTTHSTNMVLFRPDVRKQATHQGFSKHGGRFDGKAMFQ